MITEKKGEMFLLHEALNRYAMTGGGRESSELRWPSLTSVLLLYTRVNP